VTDTATAKIASVNKPENIGGLSQELAARLWDQLGSTHLAIVELKVADHTEDADGDKGIKLQITHLEPVNGHPDVADHLRELQRALYRTRSPQADIESFDDIEPTVGDVLQHGRAHLDHDDDGEPRLFQHGDQDQDGGDAA